jgi:hypothetical protein
MKKLTVWAMFAILLVAGSAFAAPAKVVANATFSSGSPATTNNDDSCDISVQPAATLLLPYFEVNLDDPLGETTLFTITNVSAEEQIAHVTLWTDYSYPVIDFNIYLTGYDVQAINLYDIIARGIIAPGTTVNGTGTNSKNSPEGDYSVSNADLDLDACGNLLGKLPDAYIARLQSAFTLGTVAALGASPKCSTVGGVHDNAVGYATIDVADFCGTGLPTEADYFAEEIRFDNVLIGDYQQVNSNENFAQGNPMVHIRAIPEGGEPGDGAIVNFNRTFYSRYQGGDTDDRRQPLPATFAARWINGGPVDFNTNFKIWREGITGEGATAVPASCATWPDNVTAITEFVVFDEEENPVGIVPPEIIVSPPLETDTIVLPETSLTSVADDSIYPQIDAVGGWMYLNLDNDASDGVASQNWVVVSMRSDGRFSVDFDAAALGNGCSPETEVSEISDGDSDVVIGPGVAETTGDQDPNYNPAFF